MKSDRRPCLTVRQLGSRARRVGGERASGNIRALSFRVAAVRQVARHGLVEMVCRAQVFVGGHSEQLAQAAACRLDIRARGDDGSTGARVLDGNHAHVEV